MRSHLPCRRDANHGELTEIFESLGCTVLDLSMVGSDCPDVLIGLCGVNVLVEIKSKGGKLEPGQERFRRDWRGKTTAAWDRDDCIAIVSEVRASLRKVK